MGGMNLNNPATTQHEMAPSPAGFNPVQSLMRLQELQQQQEQLLLQQQQQPIKQQMAAVTQTLPQIAPTPMSAGVQQM